MAGNLWSWGIDYQGQPLLDAWWTPGWSAQNKDYPQVPLNQNAPQGFPQNLNYVTVIGNYFDTQANPLSGYLTFWPSSSLTFIQNGIVTYMPQRFSGINQTVIGMNQLGSERIYLWYGALSVSLLATDNLNMTPSSFTYHVKENFKGGNQYDIIVPGADATSSVYLNSLIIPGTIRPSDDVIDPCDTDSDDTVRIAVTSNQYLAADVTAISAGASFIPTGLPVYFAFMAGASQPANSDWVLGNWANNSAEPPYVASILIGQNGHVLTAGTYKVWVKVVAGTQVPVTPSGYVEIY